MNASIKRKVNGMGLAGKIVSIVLIVCMSIGCLGLIIGTVFFAVVPKDAILLDVNTDFTVTFDKNELGEGYETITGEMLDEANEKLREGLSADGDPVEMEIGQTDDGLTVKGKTGNYRFSVSQLVPVCVSGLIKCAALLTIFVFLLRLSDAFRVCDTPFDEKVIKRMMTFAWVLLGGAIIMGFSFTGGVSGIGIYSRLGGLSYTVRFAPAIISLVVLFLTVIFRYGAKLQKEADETL